MTIDLYVYLSGGLLHVGVHLAGKSQLSQYRFIPQQKTNVLLLNFISSDLNLSRMIVTSVSPLLKIGLQFLGVWPNVSHSTIYWLIYMSSILLVQYFQYLYVFAHFEISEISNLVDGLPITLNYSLTFFKLSSLWIHRR